MGQVQPVGYLVFVDVSFLAVAGAFLRPHQEYGIFHPLPVGHCHPVAEGARCFGVIPYYYRRYGGGVLASGKFLLPPVHFLLFRAVDEYCGQVLFVVSVYKYGCHGKRFVRGHLQPFEVYGQVHVKVSVRK